MHLVQLVENREQIIGRIKITVFPRRLLQELRPLFDPNRLGLWDPAGKMFSVLAEAGVPWLNLNDGWEEFGGPLALLVIPSEFREEELLSLRLRIKILLKRGVSVLCIRSSPFQKPPGNQFAWIWGRPVEKGFLVQCPAPIIERLDQDPIAQQNLVLLVLVALDPQHNLLTLESNSH